MLHAVGECLPFRGGTVGFFDRDAGGCAPAIGTDGGYRKSLRPSGGERNLLLGCDLGKSYAFSAGRYRRDHGFCLGGQFSKFSPVEFKILPFLLVDVDDSLVGVCRRVDVVVELFVPFPCTGDGDTRVLVSGIDLLAALSGSRYAGLYGGRDPEFVLGNHGAREPVRLFVAPVDVFFGGDGVVSLECWKDEAFVEWYGWFKAKSLFRCFFGNSRVTLRHGVGKFLLPGSAGTDGLPG